MLAVTLDHLPDSHDVRHAPFQENAVTDLNLGHLTHLLWSTYKRHAKPKEIFCVVATL